MERNTRTGKTRAHGFTMGARGFTMVEMMIVISIILLLVSLAIPTYTKNIQHAREAVLRDDLFTLRQLIDEYTMDKQAAPQSLDDLVSGGYLRELPKDPFTNSNSSWKVDMEETLKAADQTQPGIVDVHSGSNAIGFDGTAYSTW